ncbi:hypothetical protein QMU90_000949 [Edwardsiella ictaluri]|uniref:Morphogenetic protein n=1 Tax=Edwardsiella ictaluri TaxID=67780 RepID=A0ABY8GDX3_EDWIC|nr:hypothetical protein [Edwardsiella ictaluri]ELV7527177.1 hypothetical protein [Edwardsiella ictaluri]WFN95512.1 hypothetical protein MAY91_11170 [Edwardsiella ictaluri]
MKERPIIFNDDMVRAILDGRKTMTRRPVKGVMPDNGLWLKKPTKTRSGITTHVIDAPKHGLCPFGAIGDRIWVREAFSTLGNEDGCPIDWNNHLVKEGGPDAARIYRASCEQKSGNYGLWSIPDDAFWKPHTDDMQYEGSWTPSIHMPRWASRITLEITDVRIERLQDITEDDARYEGVTLSNPRILLHRDEFRQLWGEIYGCDGWRSNPWVWVIAFRRVDTGCAAGASKGE